MVRKILASSILLLAVGCGQYNHKAEVDIRQGFELMDKSPLMVGYLLPPVSNYNSRFNSWANEQKRIEQMRFNYQVKFQEQLRRQSDN